MDPLPNQPAKNEPPLAEAGGPGCVTKVIALILLLLAGGDIFGFGTFLPTGLDEAVFDAHCTLGNQDFDRLRSYGLHASPVWAARQGATVIPEGASRQ